MNINLAEGYAVILLVTPATGLFQHRILLVPFHEVAAKHDHAGHPEKKDLVSGDQQRGRIKHFLIARFLRPAKSCKRQQPGRKPGVQHISVLLHLCIAALGTLLRRLAGDNDFATLAMPCGNAVSPPQLPRNTPIVDVVHPVQINLFVILGHYGDLAVFHHVSSPVRERLDPDEPLSRKSRLHHRSTAVTLAQRDGVVLLPGQKSLRLQISQDALARLIPVNSCIGAGILVHVSVLVHHIDLWQVVPQSGLEVVGIVRRRHFNRTGAELGIGQLIGDDRNLAIHQRK